MMPLDPEPDSVLTAETSASSVSMLTSKCNFTFGFRLEPSPPPFREIPTVAKLRCVTIVSAVRGDSKLSEHPGPARTPPQQRRVIKPPMAPC